MREMTLLEFLKENKIHPLTEGERYVPIIMKAIPSDVEITDYEEFFPGMVKEKAKVSK